MRRRLLTDGAVVDWEMASLISPEAELITNRTSMVLNLKHFRKSSYAILLMKKMSASDLIMTFQIDGADSEDFIFPEFSNDLSGGLIISSPADTFVQLYFDSHRGVGSYFDCVVVTKTIVV